MRRLWGALGLVAVTAACGAPSAPVPGSFSVAVDPEPVVFRQMFPGAGALALASPPPPDARFYSATMTVVIAEHGGGAGRLEWVETELVSGDGAAVSVGAFDGSCDFQHQLSRGGDRAIPPHGRLEWCIGRLATPDVAREHTLRVTPRIVDELGNVSTPTRTVRVVFGP